VSGGWTTTPPGEGEKSPQSHSSWWWWLVLVALVVALLIWRPWSRSPSLAAATASPAPDASASQPASSTPAPSASFPSPPAPSPTLSLPPVPSPTADATSTSNAVAPPTPPGTDLTFDGTGAQQLFVTADELAGALPAVGDFVASTQPTDTWGLPAGAIVTPAACQVARTVVLTPPLGYQVRAWSGNAVTFQQEVTLLAEPASAQRAFATLVSTVDECAQFTETDLVTGDASWLTQPAVEGAGAYPSIVQQVALTTTSGTTTGYRGHLLVGNAIVTWTLWSPNGVDALGLTDGLSGIVQNQALAAAQAAG